jgi:hypothetical protein
MLLRSRRGRLSKHCAGEKKTKGDENLHDLFLFCHSKWKSRNGASGTSDMDGHAAR